MRITIIPESSTASNILLAARTKAVWRKYNTAVIRSLEESAGLKFTHGCVIKVAYIQTNDIAWEGRSGKDQQNAIVLLFPKIPIMFEELTLWLIIHELGHRLLDQHGIRHSFIELEDDRMWTELEHRLLFLFLTEAIHKALGDELSDKVIDNFPAVGYVDDRFPHTRAWIWAHKLTDSQRSHLKQEVFVTKNIDLIRKTNL
jgi:hypothetical protein